MGPRDAARLVDALRRYEELTDERVLEAIARVPRPEFVPEPHRWQAWADRALPIGRGATISQPFVVAFMTEAVRPGPGRRILDIGTGSGYQAAVLAETGCEVWSVEIDPTLAADAADRLARLGYGRIRVRTGDGREGWPEAAPFDAILVAAAAEAIPPKLLEQLAPGGRIVIPISGIFGQMLKTYIAHADGTLEAVGQVPVRFVPLQGGD